MRIWIDGYEANVPQRLGSSQVALELLKHLWQIDHENEYIILLPAPPLEDLPKERTGWKYKILKPRRLWTRIALPLALYGAKQGPDIFFSPTHYIPRFSPPSIKKIVTIFDLSFLHFPEMFNSKDIWQLKNWTKFSVKNAQHIITISNFSKDDLCRQYALEREKITVAYPGFNQEVFHPIKDSKERKRVLDKYGIGDSYIIYVGTIQPRKNLKRLMEAFTSVIREGEAVAKMQLVIIGKTKGEGRQGWMFEDILKAPGELGIKDKVKFLGFVQTEELPFLLSKALVFIQPSLWEGFGIPVTEAMAVGIPVIVSNASSLPEVVGQAGFLIDPYSVDQMEQAIRTIITDKKLRQKYSKEAISQAKKFSWNKMARIVLKVFEQVEEE